VALLIDAGASPLCCGVAGASLRRVHSGQKPHRRRARPVAGSERTALLR
jgi:hypothetical protein